MINKILTLKFKRKTSLDEDAKKDKSGIIVVKKGGRGQVELIPRESCTKSEYSDLSAPRMDTPVSRKAPTKPHYPKRRTFIKEKIPSKNKYKLSYRLIEAAFPKLFNLSNPRPLSKGFREQLIKQKSGISNKKIRLGLFFYCNSHQYLASVREGKKRINATGRYTVSVTREEEMEAQKKLKSLFAKIRKDRVNKK